MILRSNQSTRGYTSIACPEALDAAYNPMENIKSSLVDLIPIFSSELFYSEYRNDPVFPAIHQETSQDSKGHVKPTKYFFFQMQRSLTTLGALI